MGETLEKRTRLIERTYRREEESGSKRSDRTDSGRDLRKR